MLNKTCNMLWKDHPLSLPIVGKLENINKITENDILEFLKEHYTLDNILISISGKVNNTDSVVSIIEESFNNLPIESNRKENDIRNTEINFETDYEYRNINQAYLCLGYKGFGYNDFKNVNNLSILNAILNGGLTSILPRMTKDELGLTYTLTTHRLSYANNGLFAIYTSTTPNNLDKLYHVIIKELDKISRNAIDDYSLDMAKNKVIGNFCFSMENLRFRMARMAQAEMYNKFVPMQLVIEQINNIQNDDVLQLSKMIFNLDAMVVSIIASHNIV